MRLSTIIKAVEDRVVSTINVVKADCIVAIDAIAANHTKKVETKEEVKVDETK
jgi:hypothetical protein